MGSRDRRVDAYIAQAAPFASPILTHLREVVHEACPDVEETIKWRAPSFMHHGIIAGMAAFKQHAGIGFWKEKLLVEKHKSAIDQLGRMTTLSDLPSRKALVALVKKAAELNESGTKVLRAPKTDQKPLPVPKDLAAALAKSKKAKLAFDAMSPSHRKEYMEWVGDAKKDETRLRRIEKTVAQLKEKKALNWTYEKC